jgi:hypothetical protein
VVKVQNGFKREYDMNVVQERKEKLKRRNKKKMKIYNRIKEPWRSDIINPLFILIKKKTNLLLASQNEEVSLCNRCP